MKQTMSKRLGKLTFVYCHLRSSLRGYVYFVEMESN